MMSKQKAPETMSKAVLAIEIVVRIVILVIVLALEHAEPFERKIHLEESWLYMNPKTDSYVSTGLLFFLALVTPSVCIVTINSLFECNRSDVSAAHMGYILALGLSAILTDSLKVIVGRPRPDFFFRCFPSGEGNFSMPCTGSPRSVREGRKSFPSGHSSIAFSSFTFLSLYLLAKLEALNSTSRRLRTHRVLLGGLPLYAALLIALSRTCDYHHHWQDVLVGSIIGLVIGYLCYRQQYPSVFDTDAATPLAEFPALGLNFPDRLKEMKSGTSQTIKPLQKWI
ncbi:phospholipid phosphatase 5 [Galendromus occidentalis]|uniref:Phospholipid phosphatase 5 n=1 Tax=Galendromus occidentalis TaxID=34638 RepID=A0AAJ6QU49_9ACAR|nr:phospholipid phosphatase 5 [Galendromus occidentalis]